MGDNKPLTFLELKKLLNDKQKKFCHRWIIDYNNVQSYMHAYPGCEYKSASASADRLLENVRIKQYIEFIKNDLEKEAGISKLKQLNELSKIAYSSIAHLHNTWVELEEFEALSDEQKAGIESIETKTEIKNIQGKDFDKELYEIEVKYVKIKLYPKIHALQEINKMMGYNAPERIEQTNTNYNSVELTKEEIKNISDELESEC